MKPNSTWHANSQRVRILMMSVISGHEQYGRKYLTLPDDKELLALLPRKEIRHLGLKGTTENSLW